MVTRSKCCLKNSKKCSTVENESDSAKIIKNSPDEANFQHIQLLSDNYRVTTVFAENVARLTKF